MAKIAILNDVHIGARNNSQIFADYFAKFYKEIFIPHLIEHDIKHVVYAGDIFDIRKFVNLLAAHRGTNELFKPISDLGIKQYCMIGNHDSFYRADLSINTMKSLFQYRELPGMTIIEEPGEIEIDGVKILCVPWIATENYSRCMNAVRNTKAEICIGHFEFINFEMYKGQYIEHGMSTEEFQKFDLVISGHYHHKSNQGNVHYLGTQYEITWADYDDQKGFHVLDTDTRSLKFVHNPFKIFKKVYYDDIKYTSIQDLLGSVDFDELKNCYVKLVVVNKTNPYFFDIFFDTLEKSDIVNLQIVDETVKLYSEFQDTEGTVEDTIVIVNRYIDGLDLDTDKSKLEGLIKSLYDEAVSLVEQN